MEVPEDLLRRIDALRERSAAHRGRQDELLPKALRDARTGGTPSSGSRACGQARPASRSRPRPAPPPQDAALVEQLRRCRELAVERRLARRVMEPLGHFQRSLEALAESQRCIQEEQRQRIQQLEAEGARRQRLQQEQALEVQEALLAQSRRREGELAGELRDLERELEAVQATDARLRAEAAQLGPPEDLERELEAVQAADARLWAEAARLGPPEDIPTAGLLDYTGQLSARSAGSTDGAAVLFGPEGHKLAQLPAAGDAWPQLEAELPRVYQESLAIILEHGWAALYGGWPAEPEWTVLHWAASEGREDVCELLLKAEADPLHEDEQGRTALDCALDRGHLATGTHPFLALECASPRVNEWQYKREEQRV